MRNQHPNFSKKDHDKRCLSHDKDSKYTDALILIELLVVELGKYGKFTFIKYTQELYKRQKKEQ